MRQMKILQPDYAARFRCLGAECEDTCCAGWNVSIEDSAIEKFNALPESPLRSLFETSFLVKSDSVRPRTLIRMLPSGHCPFHSDEHLCRIQLEHGPSLLPRICAEYPRTVHSVDGVQNTVLSPSCPEAARLVLLSPSLFPAPGSPGQQLTWDETANTGNSLRPYFWQIRAFTIGLLLNRKYSLWQRLFLLGIFCRRLEAISRGEIDRTFVQVLDDFSQAVAGGGLSAAMSSIEPDVALQLEMVLTLIARQVNRIRIDARLRQVLDLFVEGVGHDGSATLERRIALYVEAYRRHYDPFFRSHPQILENYLINNVLRDSFPYGKKLYEPGGEPEPGEAFARLAIQFATIKGLLIGVAGARREEFCASDVVRTVQTIFRHFEHDVTFLSESYETLASRGLADARGLTMLLRN